MPRFKYLGGDQRPDVFGVLEPGDVLELAKQPEWGDWETTGDAAGRQPTPQPVEPEPAADSPIDTRTRPTPSTPIEPENKEG